MRPRRRRRTFRVPEQLCFDLVVPIPVAVEKDRMQIGYFVGIFMSDGSWQLTVAPPMATYYDPGRTPQQWWKEIAAEEYTLHAWSPCRARVVGEREDAETGAKPIEQRSHAMRWLRSFNEAFQTWRMSEAW